MLLQSWVFNKESLFLRLRILSSAATNANLKLLNIQEPNQGLSNDMHYQYWYIFFLPYCIIIKEKENMKQQDKFTRHHCPSGGVTVALRPRPFSHTPDSSLGLPFHNISVPQIPPLYFPQPQNWGKVPQPQLWLKNKMVNIDFELMHFHSWLHKRANWHV